MPEIFANTTPFQYLHQLELLHILPALVGRVIVPPAVVSELEAGRSRGMDVPDPLQLEWVEVRRPAGAAVLPIVTDLGPGETEVLALGLEFPDCILVIDDGPARRTAESLGLRLRGTLGILLDAKKAGLVESVGPLLEKLDGLRFRVAAHTRSAVLRLAGEEQ